VTLDEATRLVGSNIRVRPSGRNPHYSRGRLLDVRGKYGIVQLYPRHRRLCRVLLTDIRPWKAKNA